ncbi:DUF624 domain-containing protein [Enterococcus sp. DIV0086]|uniref:DUF624 domain-containing protein n=1 Tax=Enterococcus sp. DIV0086 TaxID=2774655 RepID=UPI003D2E4854
MINVLMKLCTWVLRIAQINFLVVVGTLCGGIVFGVFPAVFSGIMLFSLMLEESVDEPIIKNYINMYKKVFLSGNKYGYLYLLVFMTGFSNVLFYNNISSAGPAFFAKIVLLFIFCLIISVMTFTLPTAIDYKMTVKGAARLFLFGISKFQLVILTIFSIVFQGLFLLFFTGADLFLLFGLYCMSTALINRLFSKSIAFAENNH